jgi:hypothetical protein
MYLLRANHYSFLTPCLVWANKEAERFYALGYFTVSIERL